MSLPCEVTSQRSPCCSSSVPIFSRNHSALFEFTGEPAITLSVLLLTVSMFLLVYEWLH